MSKISYNNIIENENNIHKENITYEFRKLSKTESAKINQEVYKSNLDTIFSIASALMKKETFINSKDYLYNSNNIQNKKIIRNNLIENEQSQLVKKNIFNNYILDVPL